MLCYVEIWSVENSNFEIIMSVEDFGLKPSIYKDIKEKLRCESDLVVIFSIIH